MGSQKKVLALVVRLEPQKRYFFLAVRPLLPPPLLVVGPLVEEIFFPYHLTEIVYRNKENIYLYVITVYY